ncbi:hypothetical protein AAEX28_11500 [Lentisphaerota bacterium WC36G]|nr:hypothetical protein LJT99_14335 [Lentisphaerae bacterium WC36]
MMKQTIKVVLGVIGIIGITFGPMLFHGIIGVVFFPEHGYEYESSYFATF